VDAVGGFLEVGVLGEGYVGT